MSKELLLIVDAVAHEKAVPKQAIFEALEAALAGAKRKQLGANAAIRVSINPKDGSYEAFRQWEVVADDVVMDDPDRQLRLMDALDEFDGDIEVGDVLEVEVEAPTLGRMAAQTVKQILIQRVRESERARIGEEWKDRVGEIVMGTIKRVEKGQVYIEMGTAEAVIPRRYLIPGERFKVGQRVRGVLLKIDTEAKGPQLIVSRTDPSFMVQLFRTEVPEIQQGLVDVMGCARDPGARAKLMVRALDKRTDPVGACIGMRGMRVQTITNELNGERVDIVLWDDEVPQRVVNAMAPAEITRMVLHEERNAMDIGVSEEKLAQAIGRGGQNVRLASQLTGMTLSVMSVKDMEAKAEEEARTQRQGFIEALDVDEEIAALLVEEGFTSLEEVGYVDVYELAAIDGFDEEIAHELQNRAKGALLEQELTPVKALMKLEGMTPEAASALAQAGIDSQEAVADMDSEELMEITGVDEATAGRIIMAARAPWFEHAA